MGQRASAQKPLPTGYKDRAAAQREDEKILLSLPFPVYPRTPMPLPRMKSLPGYAEFYSACLSQPQPRDLFFANPPVYVATRENRTVAVMLSQQEQLQFEQLLYTESVRRAALHKDGREHDFKASPSALIRHAAWKYIQLYINTGAVPKHSPHLPYRKGNNKQYKGLKRAYRRATCLTYEEKTMLSTAAAKLKIKDSELVRRALDLEFQLLVVRLHTSNEARIGYFALKKIIDANKKQADAASKRKRKYSRAQLADIKRSKYVVTRAQQEFARWTILEAHGGAGIPEALLEIKMRRARWELDRASAQLKACEEVI